MADRRETLEDLRARLLAAIPEAELKELAALSREVRQILADLDGLPSADAKAPADEIARRREDRRRRAAGE